MYEKMQESGLAEIILLWTSALWGQDRVFFLSWVTSGTPSGVVAAADS